MQAAIAEAQASPAQHFPLFGTAQIYPAAGFRRVTNPLTCLHVAGNRSCAIHDAAAAMLMVLPQRGEAWDESANLDLLRPLF